MVVQMRSSQREILSFSEPKATEEGRRETTHRDILRGQSPQGDRVEGRSDEGRDRVML